MNRSLALKVADAVLYEGYMLYPYRPSAIKNRQRWSFGILYPPGYDEVRGGTERSGMHSECVLLSRGETNLQVELRFLHLLARQVMAGKDGCAAVPSVAVDGRLIESWDEAVARTVELDSTVPGARRARTTSFCFAGCEASEPLRNASGHTVGRIARLQQGIAGEVTVCCYEVAQHTYKLVVDVTNQSALRKDFGGRNEVLLQSMLSSQTMLRVEGGEFVSLLDPPDEQREAVSSCRNVGNFPVLVGEEGTRDTLLCSPILLYDYPQIAPESAGDFYDATEIDEMLTLRVMTLTDQEKDEMRSADERARQLLQRTEETARQQLRRTHGIIRGLRPLGDQR